MATHAKPRRRLATADEVLDACHWRLARLDPERIEAATEAAGRVLADRVVSLASDEEAMQPVLAMLTVPGDRRSPWSALCAVLALHADLRGDAALFWRCGLEALACARQAGRRVGCKRPPDQLDVMLRQYLGRHPHATAADLWAHCAGLARLGGWLVAEVLDDRLTYYPERASERLASLARHAFDQRVSVARRAAHPQRASARDARPGGIWQGLVQGDALMSGE